MDGTAIIRAGRYAAWRVHVPRDGFLNANTTGATDGSMIVAGIAPVGTDAGCCGGGGSAPILQLRVGNTSIAEGVLGGGSAGSSVHTGDYYVVVLAGGGTLQLGGIRAQVVGDPDIVIEDFTTGAARQLVDVDFAAPGSPVYVPLDGDAITGDVNFTATKSMWGLFGSLNQTSITTVTDPAGTTSRDLLPGEDHGWAASQPGTYRLHLSETSFSSQLGTVALVADVDLP
jgi:hypothetical protein